MVAEGNFPYRNAGSLFDPTPRVGDGLVRIDVNGTVSYASPNARSAFSRMGWTNELAGYSLGEIAETVSREKSDAREEALITSLSGRALRRVEVENLGGVIDLIVLPIIAGQDRIGAIVMLNNVTELRRRERELVTKDATIREIHHRVKNNLQTVASLLRIQARRTQSDEAREALTQAMRRIASIALVHDTLSEGLKQNVDFDEVFNRVLMLSAEVAAIHGTTVHPRIEGQFGVLPSEYATPLALALTELVTNAVEHGLAGREGNVLIAANRTETDLSVHIVDDGAGLPTGDIGDGLGTQIVRTLIEGELGGSIAWGNRASGGTEVTVEIPMALEESTETRPITYITGPV